MWNETTPFMPEIVTPKLTILRETLVCEEVRRVPLILTQKRKRCVVKKIEFTAGPAPMPDEVIEQIDAATRDFLGTGMSVRSIPHRHPKVIDMTEETIGLLREVYRVPKSHAVVLVPGGGSSQFKAAALNLIPFPNTRKPVIGHVDSGHWAQAARAKRGLDDLEKAGVCSVRTVASTRGVQYRKVPHTWYEAVDERLPIGCEAFVHITPNDTATGGQLRLSGIPVHRDYGIIADMSSELGTRVIDVEQFDYIYAGAQKLAGETGVTIVIARKVLLQEDCLLLPGPLNVLAQVKSCGALFNTADIEAIYSVNLTTKWMLEQGGLAEMERRNREHAEFLYRMIDDHPSSFEGIVDPDSRSLVNVLFKTTNPNRHGEFADMCEKAGIVGIGPYPGVAKLYEYGDHFRVSLYNARTMKEIGLFCSLMDEFHHRAR